MGETDADLGCCLDGERGEMTGSEPAPWALPLPCACIEAESAAVEPLCIERCVLLSSGETCKGTEAEGKVKSLGEALLSVPMGANCCGTSWRATGTAVAVRGD